ncbi:ATP-binding cassette domain-containing protein [Allocoprobacillus halotolerans]|uniref:ATP-binding cassette domain-containing protein n=1 Tax=Allocoprobacillus halotolerans TaxID=2944914 RepID=A0ABY5I7B7_9FIRM|nr:ATP-binding cassette domain-containing protein [Allocoprobacillus halotolerans]UTY40672.1 ATP-binding cassette domain-containing protein [Allocoprobacillus halotolerans]
MLVLKNIHLAFDHDLIKNGEIEVVDGQLTVLFGPSGSGKSSLLYDMAFLTNQAQMDYSFNGIDVKTLSHHEIKDIQRNQISFVFQNIPLFNSMTLMENIRFFSSLTHDTFDEEKARQYLTDLELYLDDHTSIEHLSGGERQRLAIICALMKDTPYIFMDEPTAYLDEDNRQEFIKILELLKNQYHKTIIIASHDDLLKEVCDTIYEIENQTIHCIKHENHRENKMTYQKTSHIFHKLSVFFQFQFYKERWKHRFFQIFLTFILFMSTFMGVYFQYYQKQLMQSVEEYKSLQLVVEMENNIGSTQLREIESMEHIQRVEKIYPLITNNNYLICPYLETDFFYNDIEETFDTQSYTGIYINYETYRDTKDYPIEIVLDNQTIHLQPQFQLKRTFEPYTLNTSFARIIYMPYDDYINIYNQIDMENNQTPFALISLDDKECYIDVLEALSLKYDGMTLQSHQDIFMLLDVKNMADYLSGTMIVLIFIIVVISIVLLKMNDYYHSRFSEVLLEANGIENRKIMKARIQRECLLYIVPIVVVYIGLIICYWGLDMLSGIIAIYSLIILIAMTVFIFVVSMMIYMIIRKIFPTTKILKSI